MQKQGRLAQHWIKFKENRAECHLCPRHCRPKDDRMGFCGVRGTVAGEIQTFNFGLSLAATEEVIETEAINHYSPGARILSMGNVGCMMACSFCQNWETSQTQHLDYKMVRHYTPEEVVKMCLKNNIPIISWTYNDPVVWHEFVVETSHLAQKHGIKTLYKSAFYIEEEPVKELINCIDIFSLSLKSLNDKFYRKHTKARLQPVLDRIKQVASAGRYLELSQLVIPELNDANEDIEQTIDWVIQNLGTDIPLHFVAFHPAYQYTHVKRTDIETLKRARDLAQEKGMKYVYLGNTYEADLNDTNCRHCGLILVKRYGLHASVENIDQNGCCTGCGEKTPIQHPLFNKTGGANTSLNNADIMSRPKALPSELTSKKTDTVSLCSAEQMAQKNEMTRPGKAAGSLFNKQITIKWDKEQQSAHILQVKSMAKEDRLLIHSQGTKGVTEKILSHGLDRFIVSRQSEAETGIIITWESECEYQDLALLDRAHYPTNQPQQEIKFT